MDDTYTEISKIFRSVSKLVREKTEEYFGSVTPLSRVLREVADEDNCSVPNSMLREVAAASNTIQNYHQIMQTVWTCLGSPPTQWRRIYKSLCLLEYLVLLGPPRALDDCRNGSMQIRNLTNFRYHDGIREQGGGVRQKAIQIVEFVDNPATIEPARIKAHEDAAKYVGIENKPIFEYHTPATSLPPGWGELGGAWRNNSGDHSAKAGHPLPPNPYASMQRFQTAEDAAQSWGVEIPSNRPPLAQPAPSLKMWATTGANPAGSVGGTAESIQPSSARGGGGSDLASVELPPDEVVFGSAPDWWAGDEVKETGVITNDTSTRVTASNDVASLFKDTGSSESGAGGQGIAAATAATKPPPKVVTVNLLDDDPDSLI